MIKCFFNGLIRVLIFCGVKIVFFDIKIFSMVICWFGFFGRGRSGVGFFSFFFLGVLGLVGWGRGWRKRLWFGFGLGFFSGFGEFWVFWE